MADNNELNLEELENIAGGLYLSELGMDFSTVQSKFDNYLANGGWQSVKSFAINNLHIPSSLFIFIESFPNLSDRQRVDALLDSIRKIMK